MEFNFIMPNIPDEIADEFYSELEERLPGLAGEDEHGNNWTAKVKKGMDT